MLTTMDKFEHNPFGKSWMQSGQWWSEPQDTALAHTPAFAQCSGSPTREFGIFLGWKSLNSQYGSDKHYELFLWTGKRLRGKGCV
jgi:hypothetical protein